MTVALGSLLRKPGGEALLSHVLGVSKAYLHTYPEQQLSKEELEKITLLLKAHELGKPIAYLTGKVEFWSQEFRVTEATLIPRPETELIVEYILEQKKSDLCIADLGTGAGPIALSLAKNLTNATIFATDICPAALAVAKENAKNLKLSDVQFSEGDWYDALPTLLFDYIASNPPYVGLNDPHLEATVKTFEPHKALFSEADGLQFLTHLIKNGKFYLKPGGCLILEHGFQQGVKIRKIFDEMGYTKIQTLRDINQLERVTLGKVAIASDSSF